MNYLKPAIQKLAFLILISFAFCSCKTELVYFNVTEPAPVTIPQYVKKVGIINHSLISDSNGVRKRIDNVLSAKSANLDKDCSNESIRGLKDGLIQGKVFQNITVLDSVKLQNNYPGTFPAPLSWDKISEICKVNNVDALFVLELFHTDTKLNASPIGIVAAGPAALAGTGFRTNINTGWRIYDPQGKIILDEYSIGNGITFSGSVLNPVELTSALMTHKDAVMGLSYGIGQSYSSRIIPYVIRVCRDFYIKGNANFRMARRMADAGDWNNAADIWNKETNNPKRRKRARAYYNLAIISEMNGDINAAIDWATKSYETKGKRMALLYLNILKDRAADNQVLNSQMHGQ